MLFNFFVYLCVCVLVVDGDLFGVKLVYHSQVLSFSLCVCVCVVLNQTA